MQEVSVGDQGSGWTRLRDRESGCVSMKSRCERMRDGGVKMYGCESCVVFCGWSNGQSGLCDGDAGVACGHGVDRADPAGVDGGGLAVSVVASVEGSDGRAGCSVESGGTGAGAVDGAGVDVAAAVGAVMAA